MILAKSILIFALKLTIVEVLIVKRARDTLKFQCIEE